MTRIVGALQARMGSSRLPGKAMLPLAGKPLVWHMIDRMRRAGCCNELFLATTTDPRNDPLVTFCESEGLHIVREPDENDIAARLHAVMEKSGADYMLKTGGDCPLIEPSVMRDMTDTAVREKADFCSNRVRWTFPMGLSCDVLSASAIRWGHHNLTSAADRELIATWLRDHPEQFVVVSFEYKENLSQHTWMVDTPEDYAWMQRVFDALYQEGNCFGMTDVLDHLASAPVS